MKYVYLYIFFFAFLFLMACASPTNDSLCDTEPCQDPFRHVCVVSGSTYECLCNEGYKDINGQCIENITTNPCQPNPCKEPYRKICNNDNEHPVCLCNEGYHDESGVCVTSTRTVPCQSNIELPKNSHERQEDVSISFQNGVWEAIPYCSIHCNEGFNKNSAGECISSVEDPCDNVQCPQHSSCDAGTCICDSGYHKNGASCESDIKMVPCIDQSPAHASKIDQQVEITYNPETGWSTAINCQWTCHTGYHVNNDATGCEEDALICGEDEHEEAGACVSNTKQVACVENTPENATSLSGLVEITYQTGTGWSTPADCSWECINGYHQEGSHCTSNTQQVECSENNVPAHATKVDALVTITYSNDAWSLPSDCDWNCDIGYIEENGQCIETGNISCDDHFESNNTHTTATPIVDANKRSNQYNNLTICENDEDWFEIVSEVNSGLEIDLNYTHVNNVCDIDMRLYKMESGELKLIDSSLSASGRETVYVRKTTTAEKYYIKVYGFHEDCQSPYSLTANVFNQCVDDEESSGASEQDDVFEEAKTLELNTYYSRMICDYDDDWYKVYLYANERINVSLNLNNAQGDLDVFFYDANKTLLKGTYGTSDHEEIIYTIPENGFYYIKVRSWSNTNGADNQNTYLLKVLLYEVFFNLEESLAVPDDSCNTLSIDFSEVAPFTNTSITEFKINKLLLAHTFVSDMEIYVAIGNQNFVKIWERDFFPSLRFDNNNDDDDENDSDIDLINRVYTQFNGQSLGDKKLYLKLCDQSNNDTGSLNKFTFSLKYE